MFPWKDWDLWRICIHLKQGEARPSAAEFLARDSTLSGMPAFRVEWCKFSVDNNILPPVGRVPKNKSSFSAGRLLLLATPASLALMLIV